MQELISQGAQMAAHINHVCLGTNTQEDHLILFAYFFAVCGEKNTRLKLEKCEFVQESMQYLGFHIGYGWWTPAASKAKPLMDATVRRGDTKKGLLDVRSFIGASNFPVATSKLSPTPAPSRRTSSRTVLLGAGALKNNKRLTSSRTRWPRLSAWVCLEHKEKLYW